MLLLAQLLVSSSKHDNRILHIISFVFHCFELMFAYR
nr:MAG TPA: hypothetical protein [Caudoviricetes sp.]